MSITNKIIGGLAGLMLYAGVQTAGNISQKPAQTTQQVGIEYIVDNIDKTALAKDDLNFTFPGLLPVETYGETEEERIKHFTPDKNANTMEEFKKSGYEIMTFDEVMNKIYKPYGKLNKQIDRNGFFLGYYYWDKADTIKDFIPESLAKSLSDYYLNGNNDEIDAINLVLGKEGTDYLVFSVNTAREGYKTECEKYNDNQKGMYFAVKPLKEAESKHLDTFIEWLFGIARKEIADDITDTQYASLKRKLEKKFK